jgi:choline dehydrogenase-like flavoprotein
MARHLSSAQMATIAALAETVAPPCNKLPVSSADVGVAAELDLLLERFDPGSRRMVRGLATGVRWAPVLTGRGATFAALSRQRREAYVRRVMGRPGRDHDALVSLRALCAMVYAGDPRFREHLGDGNQPFKPGLRVPAEIELPVLCHPELAANTNVDCDVVVVGSGAGGATVARELALAGLDVVIVEEGGPVRRADFEGRVLHRVVEYYRDNGFTGTFGSLGGPVIPVPMGRVVGGTTVVNSGTCLRPPDAVLDDWSRNHGLQLAAPESMGPALDELAGRLCIEPVADDIMGNNGRIARRGAEALGLRAGPILRPVSGCAGTGQCAFGCPRDAKRAMHLTHLPEAVRAGARIFAGCRVERLSVKSGRVTGVEARILDARRRPTGRRLKVRARAVFLCAGALVTPALLMRAGFGRTGGGLGRHLRIHPASGVTGRFAETVQGWRGVMQSFAIDERLEDGILLEATFPPLGLGYSAGGVPGVGWEHADLLAQSAHMAAIGCMISDTGCGRIRAVPGLGPIMLYDMDQRDAARMVVGIGLAARVLFAAGAEEVYPGVLSVPVLRSLVEVEDFEKRVFRPRDLKLSAYHPMGTARMGGDPTRSVCDPSGRVHGTQNLFLADTSVFPGSTVVNPQLTLMALCLNLARRFLDEWPGTAA